MISFTVHWSTVIKNYWIAIVIVHIKVQYVQTRLTNKRQTDRTRERLTDRQNNKRKTER